MNNGGRTASTTVTVFDDCYFLACDFLITKFEHCNTEANKVAHELAKLAKFSSTFDWFEESLSEIVSLFINDVIVIENE